MVNDFYRFVSFDGFENRWLFPVLLFRSGNPTHLSTFNQVSRDQAARAPGFNQQ